MVAHGGSTIFYEAKIIVLSSFQLYLFSHPTDQGVN